jgi:hypothetical protein
MASLSHDFSASILFRLSFNSALNRQAFRDVRIGRRHCHAMASFSLIPEVFCVITLVIARDSDQIP